MPHLRKIIGTALSYPRFPNHSKSTHFIQKLLKYFSAAESANTLSGSAEKVRHHIQKYIEKRGIEKFNDALTLIKKNLAPGTERNRRLVIDWVISFVPDTYQDKVIHPFEKEDMAYSAKLAQEFSRLIIDDNISVYSAIPRRFIEDLNHYPMVYDMTLAFSDGTSVKAPALLLALHSPVIETLTGNSGTLQPALGEFHFSDGVSAETGKLVLKLLSQDTVTVPPHLSAEFDTAMKELGIPKSEPGGYDYLYGDTASLILSNKRIGHFYLKSVLSDISVITSDGPLPAHRLILMAKNSHFRTMLSGPFKEGATHSVDLSIYSSEAVKTLLHVIYTGRPYAVTPETLSETLPLATLYNEPVLKAECIRFIVRNMEALEIESIRSFFPEILYIGKRYAEIKKAANNPDVLTTYVRFGDVWTLTILGGMKEHHSAIRTVLITELVDVIGAGLLADLKKIVMFTGIHPDTVVDEKGNTMLHKEEFILFYGANTWITEFLLDWGANPNAKNHKGQTPLVCYLNPSQYSPSDYPKTREHLLVQYGADLDLPDHKGNSVTSLMKNGDEFMKQELEVFKKEKGIALRSFPLNTPK